MQVKAIPVAVTDPTKMQFPMTALGKVTVGTREYASGTVFDAEKIENVNFFKKTQTAQVWTEPVPALAAEAGAPTVTNAALETGQGPQDEAKPNSGARGVGGVRRNS